MRRRGSFGDVEDDGGGVEGEGGDVEELGVVLA